MLGSRYLATHHHLILSRVMGKIPWSGKPLQYSYMENSPDRGAWQATVHGVPTNCTWLSAHTHTHMCTYTHMHTHTHSFEPFIFIFADIFFLLKHFSLFYISSRKKIERKNYFTLWLSWSFCKQQPDGILHWLPTLISWALTPPPLELGNGGMNLLSDNVAIK